MEHILYVITNNIEVKKLSDISEEQNSAFNTYKYPGNAAF
jgi:hypothetical protein